MLKQRNLNLFVAMLLVVGLAACDETSQLVDPAAGPEGTELDLTVDEDLTDAILADAEAALAGLTDPAPAGAEGIPGLFAAPDPGVVDAARALLEQARQKFIEARRAWRYGDTELAAQLAMEGRLLIAEALVMVFGEEAYDDLLLRVDNVIAWLEEGFDEGNSELLSRIRELRAEAESIRAGAPDSEGSLIAATERLILALQIGHRERTDQRRMEMAQHARISVKMASVAIDLAAGLAGVDATERQAHLLRQAVHLRNEAARLLNAGRLRAAFAVARASMNVSLVVVLLEPGTDVGKVEWMIEVSNGAILAAEAAIGDLSTDSFLPRLLEHAKTLQSRAIGIADGQPRRAVHILWYSAVTAWAVVRIAEMDATP